MAECIVEVCRIGAVSAHPNADALELAQIKGWQVCVPKGRYVEGDLVTYIPIDSVIPAEHSDRWGITKYLSNGRVRCARLRGEPSFGVVVDREDSSWGDGENVRDFYGITKYEPPVRVTAGDAETPHPLFVPYTDIENLRHFPDVLQEGEPVVITEKIHGTNCRIGAIEGELLAGSMGLRRKRPVRLESSTYWFPLTLPGVKEMLRHLAGNHKQAILYGEVFGRGVQSLQYGQVGLAFMAFDLLLDGKYCNHQQFANLCERFDVPVVPLMDLGPFSMDAVRACAGGSTAIGGDHIREGVVVRPTKERTDPKVGRVVLKYISDDYLLSKGISDNKDE
ncbi:MAG TPA: RNA ligase (ATP) [Vicinamibacterales bacterium]|nr:RNA ligase (ATP) [Vicinamibacterales bacterium]